ncbi:unnamed protein product [Rotaria sordida]|uniref:FLYWCH-type domain-containing protein n=1 Tax=Rotaria sordida TaxID=392033 RepID=A0A814DQ67_9BILA|nr:unnamed protein product [Rotaria sordida]
MSTFTLSTSQKNKSLLLSKGFSYIIDKTTIDKTYWKCEHARKRKCKGRVHTDYINTTLLYDNDNHNHSESGEMMQSFSANWMPSKDQNTTVINTDEIAGKLEAAYGIKSGSIRISTIMINSGQKNIDGRRFRRRQLDRKRREIPRCDQLGSHRSIVEIAMNIIYPTRCSISMSCKKEFSNVIQARIAAYISSILLEFKFADGSNSEFVLTRCQKATDSSLNSLLRSRRGAKDTTITSPTTAKSAAATQSATTAKSAAATQSATTAKSATTTQSPTTAKNAASTQSATTAKSATTTQSPATAKNAASTQSATTAKSATTIQSLTTAKNAATTQSATTAKSATTTQSLTTAKNAATTQSSTTAKSTTTTQSLTIAKNAATTQSSATAKSAIIKQSATAPSTTAKGNAAQGKQLYVP